MKKQNLWNDLMDWDDPKEDEKSLILKKEGELKAYHIMQFLLLIVFLFSLFLNDSMLAANQRQLLFLIFFLFLINNSVSVFISCFQGTVGILDKKGGRSSVFFSCLLSDFLILDSVAYMRSDTAYEIIYNHSYYWVIIAFLLLIIPLLLFALYSSAYRHHLSFGEKEEYGRKKIVIVSLFAFFWISFLASSLTFASSPMKLYIQKKAEQWIPPEIQKLNAAFEHYSSQPAVLTENTCGFTTVSDVPLSTPIFQQFVYLCPDSPTVSISVDSSVNPPLIYESSYHTFDEKSGDISIFYYRDNAWISKEEEADPHVGTVVDFDRIEEYNYSYHGPQRIAFHEVESVTMKMLGTDSVYSVLFKDGTSSVITLNKAGEYKEVRIQTKEHPLPSNTKFLSFDSSYIKKEISKQLEQPFLPTSLSE